MLMTRLVVAMGILTGTLLAQDTLTLQISGFSACSVQAWNFGATGGNAVNTSTPGAAAAKSQVSNLVTTRQLDNCSVNLFKAAVTQARLSTVVLKQAVPTGTSSLPIFTMNTGGRRGEYLPIERHGFKFPALGICGVQLFEDYN